MTVTVVRCPGSSLPEAGAAASQLSPLTILHASASPERFVRTNGRLSEAPAVTLKVAKSSIRLGPQEAAGPGWPS